MSDDLASQDDIDALLAQAGLSGTEGAASDPTSISQNDIDSLLAQAGVADVGGGGVAPAPGGQAFQFQSFQESELDTEGKLDILMDVSLDVKVVLGRTQMAIEDIIRLRPGAVVELDKLAGDPLDVLVNNRLVARGEVLVLNDNFCIRITEILSPEARVDLGERG